MTHELTFESRCISSLAKVFPDRDLTDPALSKASAMLGETFSFQVAYRSTHLQKGLRVKVISDLAESVSIRSVGLVPSELPIYGDHDDHILRASPGLYPDPLYPYDEAEGIAALPGQWRSVWVTAKIPDVERGGAHDIRILFENNAGALLEEQRFELEIIPERLPKQRLIHTEWFHADCIAVHYGVDVFSEEHWSILERYVRNASAHGINMILTPLFTPPLDTAVGGERPTVQLVDVYKSGDSYRFGFDRLTRWVEMCTRNGIEYFEFSHLFTQWGAKHAPKIVAEENGGAQKIFGWETDAGGESYENFLSQFLPSLVKYIEDRGLKRNCYFHISDEPNVDGLESYRKASRIVNEYLAGYPVIDALSDFAFYEQGLVKHPIPASNHLTEFLANEVPNLWTYYCCSQYKQVANRFFCFPSQRNRIIGMQLYKFGITGFLHWGYNFWFSQYSRKPIDPFRVTDAGNAFPSGDAFVVYPGEDGPVDSLRFEVFYEALQDLRALQLLESLIGRERALDLLEEGLERPITFTEYPAAAEWILSARNRINRAIAAATGKRNGRL